MPLGKLRVLSGKEVCAIVARHGFVEVRRRGSPVVTQKNVPEGQEFGESLSAADKLLASIMQFEDQP